MVFPTILFVLAVMLSVFTRLLFFPKQIAARPRMMLNIVWIAYAWVVFLLFVTTMLAAEPWPLRLSIAAMILAIHVCGATITVWYRLVHLPGKQPARPMRAASHGDQSNEEIFIAEQADHDDDNIMDEPADDLPDFFDEPQREH